MGIKVITAPAALLTIADLRLHLKLDTTGGVHADDALVLSLLAAAAAFCEHATDRSLGSQTLELALDAFPSPVAIALPRGPVTSITSVKYIDTSAVEQTLSSGAYSLDDYSDPACLLPIVNTLWPDTLDTVNAVKVRYVAGAATPRANVLAAVKLLVGHWYEHRESVAPGSLADLPTGVTALLDVSRDYSRIGGA